jgi:hypothetical protein
VTSAGSGVPNQTGAKSSVLWNIIKDFQLGAVVTLGNGARGRVAQNSIQYLHGGTSPFATPSSSAEAGLRAAARRNKVRLSTAMTDEGYERAQEGVRRVYGGTAVAGGVGPLGAIGIVFAEGGYGVANRNNIYSSAETRR